MLLSSLRYTHLIQYLEHLVPTETDPAYLRAHVSRAPFLPTAHQRAWSDYVSIARTKIFDLARLSNTADIVGGSGRKRKAEETGEKERSSKVM